MTPTSKAIMTLYLPIDIITRLDEEAAARNAEAHKKVDVQALLRKNGNNVARTNEQLKELYKRKKRSSRSSVAVSILVKHLTKAK